jgi:hypothetical protein
MGDPVQLKVELSAIRIRVQGNSKFEVTPPQRVRCAYDSLERRTFALQ